MAEPPPATGNDACYQVLNTSELLETILVQLITPKQTPIFDPLLQSWKHWSSYAGSMKHLTRLKRTCRFWKSAIELSLTLRNFLLFKPTSLHTPILNPCLFYYSKPQARMLLRKEFVLAIAQSILTALGDDCRICEESTVDAILQDKASWRDMNFGYCIDVRNITVEWFTTWKRPENDDTRFSAFHHSTLLKEITSVTPSWIIDYLTKSAIEMKTKPNLVIQYDDFKSRLHKARHCHFRIYRADDDDNEGEIPKDIRILSGLDEPICRIYLLE